MTTRHDQEYGTRHRMARRAALAALEANDGAPCWRCGYPMYYQDRGRLHLGHDDHDRSVYRGLEHARCNTSAGATQGNLARRRWAKPPTSRDW